MASAKLSEPFGHLLSDEANPQVTCSTAQPPLSLLHKIARWNHLHLCWSLIDESGPPHCPTFGIQLSLLEPNSKETELFCGYGKSIRKAKHLAATNAMEQSSILQSILRKQKIHQSKRPISKEHELLRNLILDIPHPSGPRAEALQLARVLKAEADFFRLPGPLYASVGRPPNMLSSALNECFTSDLFSSYGCIHRVALSLGGRQFVGEASTFSGAEQEASVAFLRALRQVLISLETFAKKRHFRPQPGQRIHFRPNCSVWRLQVLAGLHRLNPSFKVFRSNLSAVEEPSHNAKKSYRCVCSLSSFEPTYAVGPSKAIARRRAAEAMLSRLIPKHSNSVASPIECAQQSNTEPDMRSLRCESTKTKAGQRFKLGRANPEYGVHIHPMARLHYIASAKGISGPKCKVSVDLPNGPQPLEECISSSSPQFRCEMQFDVHRTIGPPATSKRLAKRFAAEAMLELVGCTRPKSPTKKGVLRPSPTGRNGSPKPTEHSDHSCSPRPTCLIDDAHHIRHTSFSSTVDVLVLDDAAATTSRRPFKSRSTRVAYPRRPNSSSPQADRETLPSASSISCLPSRPICSDHTFSTTPIGHWSDSEEAIGFCNFSLLRRSRSCSTLVTDEGYAHDGGTLVSHANLLRSSLTRHHSNSWLPYQLTSSPTRTPMATKMRLLSQLAVFFLKDNAIGDDTQNDAYPDATKHLLSLCQRFQVPCKFIDRPPLQQWLEEADRKSDASNTHEHSTMVIIGEPALNTSDSGTSSSFRNTVVVQALGFNMLSARRRAAFAAFRQLACLQSHFG